MSPSTSGTRRLPCWQIKFVSLTLSLCVNIYTVAIFVITQIFFSCPFPDPVKEAISTSVFQVGLSFLRGCLSIYSNRQCFFHNLYWVVRATSRCTKVLRLIWESIIALYRWIGRYYDKLWSQGVVRALAIASLYYAFPVSQPLHLVYFCALAELIVLRGYCKNWSTSAVLRSIKQEYSKQPRLRTCLLMS